MCIYIYFPILHTHPVHIYIYTHAMLVLYIQYTQTIHVGDICIHSNVGLRMLVIFAYIGFFGIYIYIYIHITTHTFTTYIQLVQPSEIGQEKMRNQARLARQKRKFVNGDSSDEARGAAGHGHDELTTHEQPILYILYITYYIIYIYIIYYILYIMYFILYLYDLYIYM